jgi:DNA-damage-inducible protein D
MDLKIFEEVKEINEYSQESWRARSLYKILEYSEYRNFLNVIEKAKLACITSWNDVFDHFVDVTEMVSIGSWVTREVDDIMLSRYACYLVVQNADPSKEIVALWQTYFAQQTRRQELQDQKIEDQQRVYLRQEMKTHNKNLASTAQKQV